MDERAAPVTNRGRTASPMNAGFLFAARELAIRRAARDAHRTVCRIDAFECSICRAHASRISDAKAALQRESFS